MDLNGNKTLYGRSLGSNQATFVVDFLTIGGSSPQPFLYRMDLKGIESMSVVSGLIPWPLCGGLLDNILGGSSPWPSFDDVLMAANPTV